MREASSGCLEGRGVSRYESDFVIGCPHCHNLMVEETFVDLQVSPSVLSFAGWRCMICGESLDPIILQNRTLHPEPQYRRARG
jgi:transcription elongation factor Elf1